MNNKCNSAHLFEQQKIMAANPITKALTPTLSPLPSIPGHAPGCGFDDEVADWMERVQNSAVSDEEQHRQRHHHPHSDSNGTESASSQTPLSAATVSSSFNASSPLPIYGHKRLPRPQQQHQHQNDKQQKPSSPAAKHVNSINRQPSSNTLFDDDFKYPYEKYTKEANVGGGSSGADDFSFNDPSEWHKWSHERVRRAATRKDDNRNTCSLFIQTDPLIWRHIREGVVDVSIISS